MFENYRYAYVLGDFMIGFPIWAAFLYYRPDLRREMLAAGLVLGVFSVVTEFWYLKDYWHPENLNHIRIGLGDFFYGFFLGGAVSAAYEAVFGREYAKRKNRRHHWSWFLLPIIAMGVFIFDIPLHFGINSIYSSTMAAIAIAVVIVTFRKDLLWDAVASSLLFGLMTLIGYSLFIEVFPGIIYAWWNISSISGILILGIPLEELLFALGIGMAIGPAYEFFAGLQFQKQKR